MVQLVAREDWNARPPKEIVRLDKDPQGVKVHYIGERVEPGIVDDHDRCVDLVQAVQRWHMDGNGWSDTGYTAAVCPHRRVFVCRGPHVLCAANGPGLNSQHYAVVCLVGARGLVEPPPLMLAGLADAIRWLRREGDAGDEIKGHRDGYSTDCPGDPLYKIVKKWQREGLPPSDGRPSTPEPPQFERVLSWPPLMTGADVRAWQAQMRRRGWVIDVDGKFGPQSSTVASVFARRKGLGDVRGKVTRAVWDAAWRLPVT